MQPGGIDMETQINDGRGRTGPISGIRVVDLATPRGELAGRFLAELGAEVIKVEPPAGAESRSLPPFADGDGESVRSLFWEAAGLGKKSVVLDIEDGGGHRELLDLIRTADVLIESFDPGAMAAMGLGFDSLHAINPRLVFVSISPFGQTGPRAAQAATDTTLQASAGLVSLQGDWDRRPVPVGEPYTASYHSGAQAAADTVVALNERERSGLGQHLDVSVQAALVWVLMNATGFPPNEGSDPPGFGDERGEQPLTASAAVLKRANINIPVPGIWECADGYISAMLVPTVQRANVFIAALRWADEAGVLDGNGDLLEVNWSTYLEDCEHGRQTEEPLKRSLECFGQLFLGVTKRELMDRSIRDNMFSAPLYTPKDLLTDPHLEAREFWKEIDGVVHPGPFARFSQTPTQLNTPAPSLGQDQALLQGSSGRTAAPEGAPASGALRARPFEGLKVADFAWIGVGPIVAKALADHGATVVHVESETRIDSLRMAPPFKDGVQDHDLAQFFANFNSSKMGLALNLATTDGKRLAKKLTEWADVVVESFTPGTMAKLGLDYATLSQDHPDLVMLSTCLRGQTGPEAPLAGYGNSGAAIAGLHAITGWPDRAPSGPWGAYTDFVTPRLGVAALTSAIYHHRRSGEGQHIDVSQVECGIHFLAPEVLEYTVNQRVAPASGDGSPLAFPNGTYQVAGKARFVALSVETGNHWQALQKLVFGDQFSDPALVDIKARRAVGEQLDEGLRAWLLDKEPWSVAEQLADAGIPASVVHRPSDLYSEKQLTHRGFFTTLEHSKMGPTPYDGFATNFSGVPSAPRAAAPCLGEHTDQVLHEFLGLSQTEIGQAREAGILS